MYICCIMIMIHVIVVISVAGFFSVVKRPETEASLCFMSTAAARTRI